MKTEETNPHDWILFAQERLQAADALFDSLGATSSSAYILKQAAVKCLKAFLVAKGLKLEITNDFPHSFSPDTKLDVVFMDFADIMDFADMGDSLTVTMWVKPRPADKVSENERHYLKLRKTLDEMIRRLIQDKEPQIHQSVE